MQLVILKERTVKTGGFTSYLMLTESKIYISQRLERRGGGESLRNSASRGVMTTV